DAVAEVLVRERARGAGAVGHEVERVAVHHLAGLGVRVLAPQPPVLRLLVAERARAGDRGRDRERRTRDAGHGPAAGRAAEAAGGHVEHALAGLAVTLLQLVHALVDLEAAADRGEPAHHATAQADAVSGCLAGGRLAGARVLGGQRIAVHIDELRSGR